jgi:glycosyltransferase involved in cell wall biosynthesis
MISKTVAFISISGGEVVKVSVVVPLYNKGPHVKRSLSSVLSQTIQDFEVIVIEGGSNDNGPAIVKNFASSDPRIRLVQQKGTGVSEARNQGIGESKSELIAFLDADDEWKSHYLETIFKLREKYPCAGLYATSIKTDYVDNLLMRLDPKLRDFVPEEGLVLNYFKIYKNGDCLFGTSSTAVPAKVFSEIGGFQSGFWWGEDTDMWCRIALKYPVAYSSQVCAVYYQNVVNSACQRKKPVEIHPFVKSAKEALNAGEVPREIIKDLNEYIQYIEMDTAIHNIKVGDSNLAYNFLTRDDIELSYKIRLLDTLPTTFKNDFPIYLETPSKNNKVAVE